MEESEKKITGMITKILFQSNNGWGVALFKSDTHDNASIKIKGQIGQLEPRVNYELTGNFEDNDKYGKSFNVTNAKLAPTTTKQQAVAYLSSPRFFSIGKVVAEKIADYYEDNVVEKIMNDYESLYNVPGLSKAKADIIISTLKETQSDNAFTQEFYGNGLKIEFLNHLKEHVADEDEIKNILENAFYEYADHYHLQPFEAVDQVVEHFQKLKKEDATRLAWFAHYAVDQVLHSSGDTFTTLKKAEKAMESVTGIFDEKELFDGLVKAKEMKLLYFVDQKVYTKESWEDEDIIANLIAPRIKTPANNIESIDKVDDYIDIIEKELAGELNIPNFRYDEYQRAALKEFAKSSIFLLTGGPGTGKTITIKGMFKLYKLLNDVNRNNAIAVAAPTGRAAARINEIDADMKAITIHKLIGADEEGFYKFNADNPLDVDMIILDESSMIENSIFARFLQAARVVSKIVLVGDQNQLPSVGYGELFVNLLQVKEIPKMNLNNIHRQASGNGIIDLSYMVLNNEIKSIDDIKNLNNVEVHFDESENQLDLITDIFKDKIASINDDITNLQIITPYYKGEAGISAINGRIQDVYQTKVLNKKPEDLNIQTYARKNLKYIEDDKIMYLVNDSEIGLSNGDVGIIKKLSIIGNKLENAIVDFNGNIKQFYGDNFNNTSLSYACSVHKTQGSEYDDVIFSLEKGMHEYLLNKKIIYTALTRARNNLILVGNFDTFLHGINKEAKPRLTTLVEKIESKL